MAGGGIGEAMLIGAAMGGGSAALTGGDPLKGALLGGLTGGAGAGIGGALAGGAEAATLAATVPEAATVAQTAAQAGTQVAGQTAAQTGIAGLPAATEQAVQQGIQQSLGAQNALQSGLDLGGPGANTAQMLPPPPQLPTSFDSFGNSVSMGSPAATMADPTGLAQQQLSLNTAARAAPQTFTEGLRNIAQDPTKYIMDNKYKLGASALAGAVGGREEFEYPDQTYRGPLSRYRFDPDVYRSAFAEGGIASLASGGYDRVVGEEPMYPANMARGGISDLGGYSDYARGGRMLRGPGDGMSDSIPASIEGKRPARLANEEFVVPADVVSHLGNGSSDAGAKQLYAMMDKVRTARTGRKAQGREINPSKYMPAYA